MRWVGEAPDPYAVIGWKAATFITLAAFGFVLVMIWLA
jgi:hypothetical protein